MKIILSIVTISLFSLSFNAKAFEVSDLDVVSEAPKAKTQVFKTSEGIRCAAAQVGTIIELKRDNAMKYLINDQISYYHSIVKNVIKHTELSTEEEVQNEIKSSYPDIKKAVYAVKFNSHRNFKYPELYEYSCAKVMNAR